jgi:hypothetical protein
VPTYAAKQGDHISSIAKQFGFRDFLTIWNHPNNSALKKLRKNPNVLFPGDSVFVPDPLPKSEGRPTGAVHKFQIPNKKLKLRIVLRDFDNQPIPNANCSLEVDGTTYALTTTAKGLIECEIQPTSQDGVLKVPALDLEFPIKIGYLNPVAEDEGAKERLMNLGYLNADLPSAIEEFQCDYQIPVNGELDGTTMAKLESVHDQSI